MTTGKLQEDTHIMKTILLRKQIGLKNWRIIYLFALCVLLPGILNAQKSILFDSDEILEFTLKWDSKALNRDRGDNPQYHKAIVQYKDEEITFNIPLKIKSRGNFRKSEAGCKYPPLFLNFKKKSVPEASVFYGQDKMKLVTPCRGDEYVVQEYLVYKLYNLFTPKSFRARLVKVVYQDTVRDKSSDPLFGILLEEEDQMAKRNDSKSISIKKLSPLKTRKEEFLEMATFEYLIGNTDWSIQYQQNIKLLKDDTDDFPIPVPYDFDHAGIVRAPYAKPAEELKMASTLQRRYRGYCIKDMSEYDAVFKKFNELKDAIYAIYEDNELLSANYKKQTLKFLDDFYETINSPKKAKIDFTYPCDPRGTGNVIIKGLNVN